MHRENLEGCEDIHSPLEVLVKRYHAIGHDAECVDITYEVTENHRYFIEVQIMSIKLNKELE